MSGDLGVKHLDGYIELKDRSKDIIVVEKISAQLNWKQCFLVIQQFMKPLLLGSACAF